MNKLLPVAVALGAASLQVGARSQPQVDPNGPESSTYSIAELERFLGGRTLISLNVKDASMQEVANAMSQSSGLKIVPFSPVPEWAPDQPMARFARVGGVPVSEVMPLPSTATFTLAAQDQLFWEALRSWNLEARRAAKESSKGTATKSSTAAPPAKTIPISFAISGTSNGWQTIPGNWLADGRAVSAWPFLVVATDLQRAQDARLSATGLREPEQPIDHLAHLKRLDAKVPAPAPASPLPEEKRWSDHLILNAYALPDPKLFPTDLSCEVTEAVDDKGNDLRLTKGVTLPPTGSTTYDLAKGKLLQIALASKPGMGTKVVRLRGLLRFSLVTRTHHWETTDLTTPVDNTLRDGGGDFKIRFKGVTQQGNAWAANFEAESQGAHLEQFWRNRDHSDGSRGVWGMLGIDSMRLVDANGRTFQRGTGAGWGTDGTFLRLSRRLKPDAPLQPVSPDLSPVEVPADAAENWFYYESQSPLFSSPAAGLEAGGTVGPPVKLIVDFDLERRQVAVPFEFTNLPLPQS
jgi:hypothetical protein